MLTDFFIFFSSLNEKLDPPGYTPGHILRLMSTGPAYYSGAHTPRNFLGFLGGGGGQIDAPRSCVCLGSSMWCGLVMEWRRIGPRTPFCPYASQDLLSSCGGDFCSALPWLALQSADFSYNALKALDSSLVRTLKSRLEVSRVGLGLRLYLLSPTLPIESPVSRALLEAEPQPSPGL